MLPVVRHSLSGIAALGRKAARLTGGRGRRIAHRLLHQRQGTETGLQRLPVDDDMPAQVGWRIADICVKSAAYVAPCIAVGNPLQWMVVRILQHATACQNIDGASRSFDPQPAVVEKPACVCHRHSVATTRSHMTRTILSLALLLLASSQAAMAANRHVDIINKTGMKFKEFYASSTGSNNWEEHILACYLSV